MSKWGNQILRHPEEFGAQRRASKGLCASSSSFEGRASQPSVRRLRPLWRGHLRMTAVLVAVLFSAPAFAQPKQDTPRQYGIGHVATPEQIAGWDIDVRPDGQGAPPGRGSVKEGEQVYMEKCAACHGEFGESAGRWPQLAQGKGTLASHDPVKTVGSYFPYLSSLVDYVRRSMPFGDAQSLSNDELYAVVAYVLNLNDIVDEKFVLSKETWGAVKMPNSDGFFDDDREKSEKSFWTKSPCMNDCRGPVTITGGAGSLNVTPVDEKAIRRGAE